MTTVCRIIGGAGTGKTSHMIGDRTGRLGVLGEWIENRQVNAYQVGYCSFTRAARAEAAERAALISGEKQSDLEKYGWFRTIHSVCYKALEAGKELLVDDKDSRKWIAEAIGVAPAATEGSDPEDEPSAVRDGASDELNALALWDVARARLSPLEPVWDAAQGVNEFLPDWDFVRGVVDKYEQIKRLDGRLDFNDLLGRFAGVRFGLDGHDLTAYREGASPPLKIWFFDEWQDASALLDRCARRLAEAADVVYVGGDPFQCQPAGTPVLTQRGYKPIEEITQDDGIIAFDKKGGKFYGRQKKMPFQRSERIVDSGDLLEITCEDGTKHVCTKSHKWVCRIRRGKLFATYLMRRGDRWRIGTVQMFSRHEEAAKIKGQQDFRLIMRCNQEKADEVWILKVFDTDAKARMYEQICSCKFGIPQVTFRPPSGGFNNLTQEFIDGVFESLGDLTANGEKCIESHGLLRSKPFWKDKHHVKHGPKASRFIEACNLIPGITLIPKLKKTAFQDGRSTRKKGVFRTEEMKANRKYDAMVEWEVVIDVRSLAPGIPTTVYGLNVEKHHTYVTKQFVTGNSIYGFGGSDPKHIMGWEPTHERILRQSFRCPKLIQSLGESILRECTDYWDREIQPRDAEGQIDVELFDGGWVHDVDPREPWMLLARSNAHVRRLTQKLDAAGLPWLPTRGFGGKWAAPVRRAACLGLISIEHDHAISAGEWTAALKFLPSKTVQGELIAHGAKAGWTRAERPASDLTDLEHLGDWGATELLQTMIRSGRWTSLIDNGVEFRDAWEQWGYEAVLHPKVVCGTVHSVKGAESNSVVLLTTTSRQCSKAMEFDEAADEERRVAYVGVTRARERLVVLREKCLHRMDLGDL